MKRWKKYHNFHLIKYIHLKYTVGWILTNIYTYAKTPQSRYRTFTLAPKILLLLTSLPPENHWFYFQFFLKISCKEGNIWCADILFFVYLPSSAWCFQDSSIIAYFSSSFLFIARWYSIVLLYHSSFIHLPVQRHLGY